MPGKLRVRSGEDVVRIFGGFGFRLIAQRGTHVKLRREAPGGRKQTLHIPHCIRNCGKARYGRFSSRPPCTYPRKTCDHIFTTRKGAERNDQMKSLLEVHVGFKPAARRSPTANDYATLLHQRRGVHLGDAHHFIDGGNAFPHLGPTVIAHQLQSL